MDRFPKIEVARPGTTCTLGLPTQDSFRVHGVITAVAVYTRSRVLYLVSWWDGRSRKEEWIDAVEVEFGEDRLTIGFRAE